MKASFWDIFTALVILAILVAIGYFALVFTYPSLPFNPFPPNLIDVPTLVIPSATPTVRKLPPTWTPTAQEQVGETPAYHATSTLIPTITPFVLPTFTMQAKTVYPTNSRLPLEGKCKVLNQTPADGTTFAADEIFTAAWTLQNTSDTNWGTDGIDVRFKAGEAMHTSGEDVIDLPQTVVPGGRYDITIQMKAPSTTGYHITYWSLMEGDTPRCTFYVEIFVKN
jgi:hypothetical protein